MKQPINIVCSSGPVGGKTELIKYLYSYLISNGYHPFVVPEVSTMLEKTGIHPIHLPHLPDSSNFRQDGFQHVVAAMYMQMWKQVEIEIEDMQRMDVLKVRPVILHDRGFLDQKVYCKDTVLYERLQREYLGEKIKEYCLVIHMQSLAVDKPEEYKRLKATNKARFDHETVEYAAQMDADFLKAWTQVPNCKVETITNHGDFKQKLWDGITIVHSYLQSLQED